MKLLQLAHYAAPYPGSFIPMIREMLVQARLRGFEASVALPAAAAGQPWREELETAGASLHFLPMGSRGAVAAQVADVVGDPAEPTVLHTHFTSFDLPAAAIARRYRNVRAFWHLHSHLHSSLRWRMQHALKLVVPGRSVSGFLCVGPHLAEAVRASGARAERVHFIRNAISLQQLAPIAEGEAAVARAALGVAANRPLLLHFGWDWQRKGGDLFVRALRLLRERGRDVVGVCVGAPEGAVSEDDRAALGDAWHPLPPTRNVRELFAASDAFVSCSRIEAGSPPFAVAEALALGLPVVAANVAGQDLQPAPPGYRLAALDGESIAAVTDDLLARGAERRTEDARTGRGWVETEMNLSGYAAGIMSLYERALADRS